METMLAFLGVVGRLTYASEEVYSMMLASHDFSPAVTGIASDARTAVLARFRYLGLDVYMDQLFEEFRKRSQEAGLGNVTVWMDEEGKAVV